MYGGKCKSVRYSNNTAQYKTLLCIPSQYCRQNIILMKFGQAMYFMQVGLDISLEIRRVKTWQHYIYVKNTEDRVIAMR